MTANKSIASTTRRRCQECQEKRGTKMFSFYRQYHKDSPKGDWATRYTFKTRKEAQAKLKWIYENTDWLLNGYVVKKISA